MGGIERHVRDLARAESTYPEVEVEVLCVAEDPDDVPRSGVQGRRGPALWERDGVWERDGRVAVKRVPQAALLASNPVSLGVMRELRVSAKGREHDIWHFHYPFPTGEAALLALGAPGRKAAARRPRVVCTYHSDAVGDGRLKWVLRRPYFALTSRFLAGTDRIIVASPGLASHSRLLGPFADKVRVVPFGVDPVRYRLTSARTKAVGELRARYGTPIVLFVGRLVPYKGLDVLLRAFARLACDLEATLVLVGDGPLRLSLEALARSLGLGVASAKEPVACRGTVVFAGGLTDEELVAHYYAADVFVLPSVTRNEAFGLVQIEAHMCGLPVVSTNLPTGVPFANADGVSGLVVDVADAEALARAVGRLLRDDELRRRLGAQAKERARREFTLRRMVEGVFGVYDEALL